MSNSVPISIASSAVAGSNSTVSEPLKELIALRVSAYTALDSPQLEYELQHGQAGPNVRAAAAALQATIDAALAWQARPAEGVRLSPEEEARGTFILAWARSRLCEYDGTDANDVPSVLLRCLQQYDQAGNLLSLPEPPELEQLPSITRPLKYPHQLPLQLTEYPAWVGEFLAEWARTQVTLALSKVLITDTPVTEDELAVLLEQSCRKNAQALFTPIDEASINEGIRSTETGTVKGNARLIKEISLMYPWTSSNESLWAKRMSWATHIADVYFAEASMNANQLMDHASTAASVLQTDMTPETRKEVKTILDTTVKQLYPLEKKQGTFLLELGRIMSAAVGCLYLGKDEHAYFKRRIEGGIGEKEDAAAIAVDVPENDLVRETRQVLIRAASLFESAYVSFQRVPQQAKSKAQEQRILRRLEETYCELEILDNTTPEVVELRAQRIERALWINDKLVQLGDTNDELASESEEEDVDQRLVDRFGSFAL